MNIYSGVSAVPKIGPKFTELLNKLGIVTVKDLLYHFPFRYDDFSKISTIQEIKPQESVTVKARILNIDNIFTRNGKRLTKAVIFDTTGKMEVVWFNQHFIKNTLNVSGEYWVSGKVESSGSKKTFIAPVFEEVSGNNLNTGRLVPIYPETAGVSSNWMRSKVSFLLDRNLAFEEILPKETLEKFKFLPQTDALRFMHFPESLNQLEEAKRKLAFEELFVEIFKAESRKELWNQKDNGAVIKAKANQIEKLTKNLPFELSDSQTQACNEILNDLAQPHPMNRLLEGDVGTGKTMVALVAAYAAHVCGFKTLYMAPTEILAKQHFATFCSVLDKFQVRIALRTGSTKTDLADGNFDIAVGTHSLLHVEEELNDVGLIVIDEQHRFGVAQRARIAEMAKKQVAPNILTMTATPIPRTLALSIYGDLEISRLQPIPSKERKITTRVVSPNKREEIYHWIKNQNKSAFVVCPLIEDSESETLENVRAAEVEFKALEQNVFGKGNIGLLHGKMKSAEKEEMIAKFKNGLIKVLVATPVIEVGIDIPEASIMVIESAERYGLASLHQLRGRVGRDGAEGFCFLIPSVWTKYSVERLKNLEITNKGLELAEIDMRIRGQGDLFGIKQHGIKKFKVATLDDYETIKLVKSEVQRVINSNEANRIRKVIQTLEMHNTINN